MNNYPTSQWSHLRNPFLSGLVLLAGWLVASSAGAFTLNVVDAVGNPVPNFRWLLEEDTTSLTRPGVPTNNSIGLIIHKSYAPVLRNGTSATATTTIAVPATTRYIISVLAEGYSVGGANVTNGQAAVRVVVNKNPIPTAQITVIAFVDQNPINNLIDETEPRLGGCKVVVTETLGQVSQDFFGNPLGTRYLKDAAGNFELDGDGNPMVETMGTGVITTLTQRDFDAGNNPDNLKVGEAVVKNLAASKYGVVVVPPNVDDDGNPLQWVQTTTIEGTPKIDAWVKANEPAYYFEGFGTGFKHVAHGFVKVSPTSPSVVGGTTINALPWNASYPTGGTARVEGTLRHNHFSRPPTLQGYFPGDTVPDGWIGLNDPTAQLEGVPTPGGFLVTPGGLYAAPCDANGHFVITNLPAGQYQLATWDKPLDDLFGLHPVIPANRATFTVAPGENLNLSNVLVFRWFGTFQGSVFYDFDQDGFRDPAEPGIPRQAINIRFRNGTIYQSTQTSDDGSYELDEVFPFFKWLIAEVDYARYKVTGMSAVVDAGGAIPGPGYPAEGVRTPQPQFGINPNGTINSNAPIINPNTGDNLVRTELSPDPAAPLLLEAMHLFLSQNNRIDWGKVNYPPGENGGIAGIGFYGVTRAEEDPRFAVGEPWEAGIPRVQYVLYQDADNDKVIDDLDGDGHPTVADIDNHPFQWTQPEPPLLVGTPGPEDVDRDGDGQFNPGDAIQIAWADSWDDLPPSGSMQPNPAVILGKPIIDSDNFGTWNQIRPGVFDGGYLFGSYFPGGMANPTGPETDYLPPGMYVIQCCPPPGYLIVTEESVNVGFGDTFIPSKLLLAPECVGTATNHSGDTYVSNIVPSTRTDPFTVPPELSLFPGEPAPYAGEVRPLADMKWVRVAEGRNSAADFHLYTEVPKAARAVGFVLNDLAAEFNQGSPNYGEKLAAPWIPISFRDWYGTEVQRVYSDEFGVYEALLPTSINVHIPQPSGVAETMFTIVLNDPLLPDGTVDPFYNPTYLTTPWTFNFLPGGTTYCDTPLVPLAAFTTSEKRIDTEPQDGEPVIKRVDGPESGGGPWMDAARTITRQITITSMGSTSVLNPNFNSSIPGSPFYVVRDYSFGATPGSVSLCGITLSIVSWGPTNIVVSVPLDAPSAEILVTRSNGRMTQIGVTFHFVNTILTEVYHVPADFPTIQAAIDSPALRPGDLVLVAPGVYNENVVLYKPIHLQGYGAGSTIIYGNPTPLDRLQTWHDKVNSLGAAELAAYLIKDPFLENEAPVVLICGELTYATGSIQIHHGIEPGTKFFNRGNRFTTPGQAQLDGFTLQGSKAGGGVFVLCGARYVQISNNNIHGNQGGYGGAISVGTPDVATLDIGLAGFDAANHNVLIHRNRCHRNAGIEGAGGISMNESAHNYLVEDNLLMGNFTRFNGGGFSHRGLCGGTNVIRRNSILFNEIVYETLVNRGSEGGSIAPLNRAGDGGGIYIGAALPFGEFDPAPDPGNPPVDRNGEGTGHVIVDHNLIQGNITGSGRGGGIRVFAVNGLDVILNPPGGNPDPENTVLEWYELKIINNVIVNNVAAGEGAGISLQEAVRATIAHNTIANNDSTATSALLFNVGSSSPPQGAGIVVHTLTPLLTEALGTNFVSPEIFANIIWHNRSFYFDPALNAGAGGLAPRPAGLFWDLAVAGGTGTLNVTYCLLTSTAGFPGNNISGNPGFVAEYTNSLQTASVIDEGGNNISIRFLPISPTGNYHILSTSAARDWVPTNYLGFATNALLRSDFDGQWRPFGAMSDIGADEFSVTSITASNDFYMVLEDGTLTVPAPGVLANDSGASPLSSVLSSGPAHGTVTFGSDGSFVYQPDPGSSEPDTATVLTDGDGVAVVVHAAPYSGPDSFTYRARNSAGTAYSLEAMVCINVKPINHPPVATADTYSVNGNSSITVPAPGVLLNDFDMDRDPRTASLVSGPSSGTLTFNPDGSFTFTPVAGFTGNVTFTYSVNDGIASSSPATVTLNVTARAPDFVVTGISVDPQPVQAGTPMAVSVTVSNRGTASGNAGTLTIYNNVNPEIFQDQDLLDEGPLPPNDVPAGTPGDASVVLGSLAAGASTTVVFNLTAPPIAPLNEGLVNPVFLRAFVNSALPQEPEFSTNNNQLQIEHLVVAYGPALGTLYPDTDGVDTDGDGIVNNDNVVLHLAFSDGFVKMADGKDMYMFGFSDVTGIPQDQLMATAALKANLPAPTIALREGQKLFLKLSNLSFMMRPDLEDTHSIHYHGFPNAAPVFDGVPENSMTVRMGSSFTYFYNNVTVGTFIYHCHVEATEHIQMGMMGQLFVMPKQNLLANNTSLSGFIHHTGFKYAYNDGDGSTYYDVEYPIQVSGFDGNFHDLHLGVQPLPFALMEDNYPMLNGRGYPDTINTNQIVNMNGDPSQKHHSLITATRGQKVLLRISSLSTVEFQTLTIAGIPMKVIGKGAALLRGPGGQTLYYNTSSITLGGGEAFDVILDTSLVPAGTYFLYATRLHQLSNAEEDNGGMMTEIVIKP